MSRGGDPGTQVNSSGEASTLYWEGLADFFISAYNLRNEIVGVGIFYEELRLGFSLVIAPLIADIEHDAVALRDNRSSRA